MIEAKSIYKYIFAMTFITFSLYVAQKLKHAVDDPNEEYKLIQNYLLNDIPIYGFNKPKIWVHTKFEYNARKWKSFGSRSSTDLNQPYIHITVRSIIDHCGDDFHICLIDDATFSKLIPSWDIELTKVAEPMRTHIREIGMLSLVYHYGGMILPNSFLCISDAIKTMFDDATRDKMAFACEAINRKEDTMSMHSGDKRSTFIPSTYILGAKEKENPAVADLIDYLKSRYKSQPHFTAHFDFIGLSEQWLAVAAKNKMIRLVDGKTVGVKTKCGRPILLDDLMSEHYLKLGDECVGICIPEDELLERTKYQWFAVLTEEQIWETNCILAKYMKAEVLDGIHKHYNEQKKEIKSVVAI